MYLAPIIGVAALLGAKLFLYYMLDFGDILLTQVHFKG